MHASPAEGLSSAYAEIQKPIETFDEAFTAARDAFYAIPSEPEFQALCAERNISADDMHSARYWSAASDFAHRKITEQRQAGAPESELGLKELVASLPDAVYTQIYLNTHHGMPREKIEGALRAASYFNGLIRAAADNYPDVTPSHMTNRLMQIANISIERRAARNAAPDIIDNTVRGAQLERQHRQLLDAAGIEYRETSVQEDVFKGADYIATRDNGSKVSMNIKASPWAIRNLGGDGSHIYDHRGVLIVSMISPKEAGDSFSLDPSLAAEKAPMMHEAVNTSVHTSHRQHAA